MVLKHRTGSVHRKVLHKVRKHFVAVTVAGGVAGAFGIQQASAQQEALGSQANEFTDQHQNENNEGIIEPIQSEAKSTDTEFSSQPTDERSSAVLSPHNVSQAEDEDEALNIQTSENYNDRPEEGFPNPEFQIQDTHESHPEEVGSHVSSHHREEDDQVNYQTVDNFNHQPADRMQRRNNTDAPPQHDLTELDYLQSQDLDRTVADEAPQVSNFYSLAEPINDQNQNPTSDSENHTERATIVHTNDIHGRIDYQGETDADHGMAYIDAVANYFRETSDEFILLDAGDTIHGTTTVNQTEGQVVVELMNELGYAAMAPGNHEFNFEADRLIYLAEHEMNFPIIAANVVDGETGELIFDPFTEWQVFGNNIGIIGLGTPDTYTTTHPDNVVGVEFTDSVQAIKDVLETNGDSFDYVIVLSHIGLGADREIAEEVESIDLIIGGHSHTPIPGGEVVNGTVITQAWEHGKTIGTIHLDFVGGELVSITPELVAIPEVVNSDAFNFPAPFSGQEDQVRVLEGIRPSATIQAYVDEAISTVEGQLDANVIGYTNTLLNGERGDVRTESTNLGGLVTDSMRDFAGADIAVVNGGGIRASIQPGEISQLDVLTVLPFINLLEVQELPGSVILEALEWGVRNYPEQNGGLLHVSGMTYIADGTRPVGERIVYAEIGGAPLDPNVSYSVATTDFLTAGGDGFQMFTSYPVLLETGELLSDITMNFIENNGTTIYEDFTPRFIISDQPLDGTSLHQTLEALNIENERHQDFINRGETLTILLEDFGDQETNLQAFGDDLPASLTNLSTSATQAESQIAGLEDPLAATENQLASKEMKISKSPILLPDRLIPLNQAMETAESYQRISKERVHDLVTKDNQLKAGVQVGNEGLEEKRTSSEKHLLIGKEDQPLPDTATTIWSVGLVGLITLTGGVVAGRMKKIRKL